MDVLVLANQADPETGFVGEALLARGARLREVWRDDLVDSELEAGGPDLVLVLGSEWHVYDEAVRASTDRETAYLRAAVGAGTPVFGICYGAQLLAHALGGVVSRHPDGGELGWYPVDSDDAAIPEGPYVQWHSDVFTVPEGAVELARSPVGPQAFAYGSAFAVQFHPEVTPEVFERWITEGAATVEKYGLDRAALIAEAQERATASRGHAEALVEAFLAGAFKR